MTSSDDLILSPAGPEQPEAENIRDEISHTGTDGNMPELQAEEITPVSRSSTPPPPRPPRFRPWEVPAVFKKPESPLVSPKVLLPPRWGVVVSNKGETNKARFEMQLERAQGLVFPRSHGMTDLSRNMEAMTLHNSPEVGPEAMDYRRAYAPGSEEELRRKKAYKLDMMFEQGACVLIFAIATILLAGFAFLLFALAWKGMDNIGLVPSWGAEDTVDTWNMSNIAFPASPDFSNSTWANLTMDDWVMRITAVNWPDNMTTLEALHPSVLKHLDQFVSLEELPRIEIMDKDRVSNYEDISMIGTQDMNSTGRAKRSPINYLDHIPTGSGTVPPEDTAERSSPSTVPPRKEAATTKRPPMTKPAPSVTPRPSKPRKQNRARDKKAKDRSKVHQPDHDLGADGKAIPDPPGLSGLSIAAICLALLLGLGLLAWLCHLYGRLAGSLASWMRF